MKLKKKLQEEKLYINPYSFKLTKEGVENFEKIFDDYAIEFLEYYHNSLFFIPLKENEAKEILKIFKKKKKDYESNR
jgi:hypothetical protein